MLTHFWANVSKFIYKIHAQFSFVSTPLISLFQFLLGIVVQEFNVPGDTTRFSLADNLDAPMNRADFGPILNRYGDQASFFINVGVAETTNRPPVVTVKVICLSFESHLLTDWRFNIAFFLFLGVGVIFSKRVRRSLTHEK